MMNFAINDKLVRIISLFVILFGLLFWFSNKHIGAKNHKNHKKRVFSIVSENVELATINGPSYDYGHMLELFNVYRSIYSSFYSDFDSFVGDPKNLIKLKFILDNLIHERDLFRAYLRRIKAYYRRFVPTRKNNSLRYQFRVLDEYIDETEQMIEKFALKMEQGKRQSKAILKTKKRL